MKTTLAELYQMATKGQLGKGKICESVVNGKRDPNPLRLVPAPASPKQRANSA